MKGKWLTNNTWVCNRHLPSVVNNASQGNCTIGNCLGVRPRPETTLFSKPTQVVKPVVKVVENTTDKCFWFKCNNTSKPRSKYCSIQCKNRNARHNYRLRQKTLSK